MNDTKSLHDDLRYVRSAVERSHQSKSPSVIWYLWAAISLIGFALVDLRPSITGLYWVAAAPLGFILSIWLARRAYREAGLANHTTARRWTEHWAGLLVAFFLLVLGAFTGHLDGRTIGLSAVLLTALAYFTAGVHLESKLKWIGLLIVLAYPALLFLDRWGWTATGIVLTIALLMTGITSSRETTRAR